MSPTVFSASAILWVWSLICCTTYSPRLKTGKVALESPEMKSTGESILFIDSLKEDAFYDLYARRKMYLTK